VLLQHVASKHVPLEVVGQGRHQGKLNCSDTGSIKCISSKVRQIRIFHLPEIVGRHALQPHFFVAEHIPVLLEEVMFACWSECVRHAILQTDPVDVLRPEKFDTKKTAANSSMKVECKQHQPKTTRVAQGLQIQRLANPTKKPACQENKIKW
jgi:hypothetical protein